MKPMQIVIIILVGISCNSAYAGEQGEIELIDGSVIYGEIVSLKEGVYTILSSSMGDLKISESKVRAIRFPSHDANKKNRGSLKDNSKPPEIQALQESLINNEDILNIILSLQDDPKVQKILNDPTMMNSVLSGDIQSLMSNPKFLELLNHPKIKEIQKNMVK